MAERVQNLALVAGTAQPPFALELDSQQTPIKGVVIDNGNSSVPVYVYAGRSATGIPYIIQPGWARGFTLEGTSAVYLVFPVTPTQAGSIYLSVSSGPQVAFSTQEVVIGGTVIANINSQFPAGSTPIQNSVNGAIGQFTHAAALLLFTIPYTSGQRFFLTSLVTFGLSKQLETLWEVGFDNAGVLSVELYGYGDVVTAFDPPIVFPFFATGVGLIIGYVGSPTTPWNIAVQAGGYYM